MVGVDLPQTKVNAQRSSAKKSDDIRRISDVGKPIKPPAKKASGFFDDYDFDDPKENRGFQESMNNGSIRRVSDSGKPVKAVNPLKKKTSAIFDDFDLDNLKDELQQSYGSRKTGGIKALDKRPSATDRNNARVNPVKNVESDSLLEYGSTNLNKSHRNATVGKRIGGKLDEEPTKDFSKGKKLPFLDNVPEKSNKHYAKDNNPNNVGNKEINYEKHTSVFGGERKKWGGPKRSNHDDDLEDLMNEIENSNHNNKAGSKVGKHIQHNLSTTTELPFLQYADECT